MLFAEPKHVEEYINHKYKKLINDQKCVAIHYRDYQNRGRSKAEGWRDVTDVFCLASTAYYRKAIKQFPKDSHFVFFSDNIPVAKKKFGGIIQKNNLKVTYIEDNHYLHDFYLMSRCKHQIISNSTFAWWAAYLNSNPNKIVVAPKKWFQEGKKRCDLKDLFPEGWIVL